MLVVGFIIGIFIILFLGYLVSKSSSNNLHVNKPIIFGNLTIRAVENTIPNDNIVKCLNIMKDGQIFFYAELDVNNKINNIALVSSNNDIRFSMASSREPGRWKNAMYSYDKDNKTIGDEYIDTNFDGRFDVKLTFDANGNRKSVYISLNDQWEKVDSIKGGKAIINGQTYIFTDSQWMLNK